MSYNLIPEVNNYALRAFRDTADKDYILARMAYKAALFPNLLPVFFAQCEQPVILECGYEMLALVRDETAVLFG